MEAAQAHPDRKPITSEKALRIVEAMRKSISQRGSHGSTFDNVAREAGVSRGLLHYYFGSKERLIIEVIRDDGERRLAAIEAALSTVTSVDEVVDLLFKQLRALLDDQPEIYTLGFEMISEGRRNPEIAAEASSFIEATRDRMAEILLHKQEEGVIKLHHSPRAAAELMMSMANGLVFEMIGNPEANHDELLEAAVDLSYYMLGGERR